LGQISEHLIEITESLQLSDDFHLAQLVRVFSDVTEAASEHVQASQRTFLENPGIVFRLLTEDFDQLFHFILLVSQLLAD